jgi:hypothetical protein
MNLTMWVVNWTDTDGKPQACLLHAATQPTEKQAISQINRLDRQRTGYCLPRLDRKKPVVIFADNSSTQR